MIKNFKKIFLIIAIQFLLTFSIVNAECKFMMNIGQIFKKSHENKYGPLPENEHGFAEVEFIATEFCPDYGFDDNFLIKYTFLNKRLLATQLLADNSLDNSATESMKLMEYAKRVYGNFETGSNPEYYNNFNIWEKVQRYVVYKRRLIGNSWEEEIYISSDKYYEQLVEYENMSELIEPLPEEEN